MSKFKVGDRVRVLPDPDQLDYPGDVGEVLHTGDDFVRVIFSDGVDWGFTNFEVEHWPAVANTVSEAQARKNKPVMTGVLDYFPDALMAVAEISRIGNEQHHPGKPLHWEKQKSADHADCCVRHMMDRGTKDTDGADHSGKAAWRALANYQTELEAKDPALAALRQAQRDAAARGER